MSLAGYLKKYYVDKSTYAALAGITTQVLDRLIHIGATPQATYVVRGDTISSFVFGETSPICATEGEYFHPGCVRWVKMAVAVSEESARSVVLQALEEELHTGLSEPLIGGYSLSKEAIENKIDAFTVYFLNGTFGLCVSDPSSGAGIARKEMLQEYLAMITDNGRISSPEGISKDSLIRLIEQYADAAMPFSPAEFERSSRKRLVDDLLDKIS